MNKNDISFYAKTTAMSLYVLLEHRLGSTVYGSLLGLVWSSWKCIIVNVQKFKSLRKEKHE